MVQVHIEGSADEIRAEMRKLLGAEEHASGAKQVGDYGKASKEKKTAEPGVEPKKEKPAEPVAETKSEPKPATSPATATFQDVKDIIPKVMEKLGKPGIVDLLAKFGAKKGSELKEEQYGEFLAAAQKALA